MGVLLMDGIVDQLFSDAPVASGSEPVSSPTPPVAPIAPVAPAAPAAPATPAVDPLEREFAVAAPPSGELEKAPVAPASEAEVQPQEPLPVATPETPSALTDVLQGYVSSFGADNVQTLASLSLNLLGIGEVPEGATPQGHFLDQVYRLDQRAYGALVEEIVNSHESQLVQRLRDQVLTSVGLPTTNEALANLRDLGRYGSQYATDQDVQSLLKQVPQELHSTFDRLSSARRNWLVQQVADGYMPTEVAIEDLQKEEREYQRSQADARQETEAQQRREAAVTAQAYARADESLEQQRSMIIEQRAKADNLSPLVVESIYAIAGQEIERYAQAAMYGYSKNEAERQLGISAIQKYQTLVEAQRVGNPLAIKQALNDLRILAETRYSHHLALRRQAAVPQSKNNNTVPATQPQPVRNLTPELPQTPSYRLPNGQQMVDALFGG
jgi:hypothetical protein